LEKFAVNKSGDASVSRRVTTAASRVPSTSWKIHPDVSLGGGAIAVLADSRATRDYVPQARSQVKEMTI